MSLASLSANLGSAFTWLWLVLVPVSGWLVLQSRFFVHFMWPMAGYNRPFLIVLIGVLCTVIGIAGTGFWFFDWSLGRLLEVLVEIWNLPLENDSEETPDISPHISLLLFWSAPAGFVFGLSVNILSWFVIERIAARRRLAYLTKVNGIFSFVVEAAERRSLAMLTLSNRKVYIGWPQRISDADNPHPPNQYLFFFPFLSGYRAQDSLELVITTDYAEAYHKFGAGNSSSKTADWEIILPANAIVHAQPFDLKTYHGTQWSSPALKPASRRKKSGKKSRKKRRKK